MNNYRQPKRLDKLNKLKVEQTLNSKYGKLKPIEYLGINIKNNHNYYKCKCDCGNEVIIPRSNLNKNRMSSCGCFLTAKKSENIMWKGHGDISRTMFNHIKSGAKRRNIKFDITIEQIWDLFLKQNRKCALTGVELKFQSSSHIYDGTASLDRIDSLKGYIEGNIQWVHKDINNMKQKFAQNDFIKWCELVFNYKK